MEWLGRANIAFTHAAAPLQLAGADGSGPVSLPQICRDGTPPCQLNPLLFNGHLQTFWTAVAKGAPAVYYRRKVFVSDHPVYAGTFAVDFAVPPHSDTDPALPPRTAFFADTDADADADDTDDTDKNNNDAAVLASDDSRPMLLVLHGLSGGSYEVYLRHCVAPLLADGRDWAVAVVNARGCANSPITSGVLFNARATWDVRQVARWARQAFPNRQLFGLGFSLGANILTNYVGEEGVNCPLSAAIAVGNPFDLQVSSKALLRTAIGRGVYQSVMGESTKKLILRHEAILAKLTDLDFNRIRNVKSLYEFDAAVQCVSWGYPTAEAYYRDASSSDAVLGIRIPFLAIQAKDDPIAVDEAVPYPEFRHNPYTVLMTTSLGGHLSWFEPGGGRWHARPVVNILDKLAKEFDLKSVPRQEDYTADTKDYHRKEGIKFSPVRRRMMINGE